MLLLLSIYINSLKGIYGQLAYYALQQASNIEDKQMNLPVPIGFGENYTGINIFLYIKNKVESVNVRANSPLARRGVVLKKGNNINKISSPPINNLNKKPKINIDDIIQINYPIESVGFFKLNSIRDAIEFIEDMYYVALSIPTLIDNKIPTTLYTNAINNGIIISNNSTIPTTPTSNNNHIIKKYREKCFPTYCPPIGPVYMDEVAIAATIAILYPNGYNHVDTDKRKKKPMRNTSKAIGTSSISIQLNNNNTMNNSISSTSINSTISINNNTINRTTLQTIIDSNIETILPLETDIIKKPFPPNNKVQPSKTGGVANNRKIK